MPNQVSLPALQGMLAQRTSVVYLTRLLVEHADLSSPLRFVNDKVSHTDGSGNTWKGFPFQAVLPDDAEETMPRAEIVVSNVSRDLLIKIRALSSRPTITLSVVTDQDFDEIEWGPAQMDLLGYEATAAELRLTIGPATDYLNAAFPAGRFLPSNAGS